MVLEKKKNVCRHVFLVESTKGNYPSLKIGPLFVGHAPIVRLCIRSGYIQLFSQRLSDTGSMYKKAPLMAVGRSEIGGGGANMVGVIPPLF